MLTWHPSVIIVEIVLTVRNRDISNNLRVPSKCKHSNVMKKVAVTLNAMFFKKGNWILAECVNAKST